VRLPNNLAHQLWKPFGDPAEHEECGLYVVLAQDSEQTSGALDDPARILTPFASRDSMLEGRDVVVILNIDGKGVA
jgi:hypothetical protein